MTDLSDLPDHISVEQERFRRAARRRRRIEKSISVASILGLAGLWQLLSVFFSGSAAQLSDTASPIVPGWGWILGRALREISAYAGNGLGTVLAEDGVYGTYGEAFRVIAYHSMVTIGRLVIGFALGVAFGVGCALAISWSRIARLVISVPSHVLRTLPVLAMIPLVQVWFGVSTTGIVIFIAYGIAVIMFAGTLNAVENVPSHYIDNARTLGASHLRLHMTVILPAIAPELRASMVLCLALAWSISVGAEFLGAQSGLGFIEVQAKQFALLDRMFVIAMCFLIYAAVSFMMFNAITRPLLRWMPGTEHHAQG